MAEPLSSVSDPTDGTVKGDANNCSVAIDDAVMYMAFAQGGCVSTGLHPMPTVVLVLWPAKSEIHIHCMFSNYHSKPIDYPDN